MPNETKSQPRPSRPRTSHPQPHRRPTMYAVRGGMDDISARCGASVSGTSEERGDASRRDATAAMARFLPHATDRVGDPHLPGGRSKRFIPGRPCFVSALAPSGSTPGARETVRHWHQSTSTTSISWPARRQAPPGHQEVAELVQKHQKLTGSGAPALQQVSTRFPCCQTKRLPNKDLGGHPICGVEAASPQLRGRPEVLCLHPKSHCMDSFSRA